MLGSSGVLAQSAAAFDSASIFHYFYGSLTSEEFRSYAPGCGDHAYASGAHWTQGAGAYGTVAIIASNGTWIAVDRNNTGGAIALVNRDNPNAIKALCKNSTPWQVTVTFDCEAWVAYDHDITCV